MKISRYQKNWNNLAEKDAFWAILAGPDKALDQWKLEEFFHTGVLEIERILQKITSLQINIQWKRALDFGCGVGRLTQALSPHFERVDGVDISQVMIDKANIFNRFDDKCVYHLIDSDNLAIFPESSFDLIYSRLVLMHIPPKMIRNYLKEFVRILRPGGVLVFQIPTGPINPILRIAPQGLIDWGFNVSRNIYRMISKESQDGWEMHWMPRTKVDKILRKGGGKLLWTEPDDVVEGKLETLDYFVTKIDRL